MDDKEKTELAIKYWNREMSLVANMDVEQRRKHREDLQAIAFETKCYLQAIDNHERNERAKLSVSQKEWLVTREPDESTTNAINVVNARKTRMSKMDKINEQLKALGMDDEIRKEMLSKMEQRATEKNLKSIHFPKVLPSRQDDNNNKKEEVKIPTEDKPFNTMGIKFNQ